MKKNLVFVLLILSALLGNSQCNDRSTYWFISTGASKIKGGSAGVIGEAGILPFYSSFAVALKGAVWSEDVKNDEMGWIGIDYKKYCVSYVAGKLYYCGGAYSESNQRILIGAGAGVITKGSVKYISTDKPKKYLGYDFSAAYLLRLSQASEDGQGVFARLELSGIGSSEGMRPMAGICVFFVL